MRIYRCKTDCGRNRDYAEHEKTALVSNPDGLESLVNNVLRLLSDEAQRVQPLRLSKVSRIYSAWLSGPPSVEKEFLWEVNREGVDFSAAFGILEA
jgi:hypothetical protein